VLDSFRSPAPKMRTSPDRWHPEGAGMESCCSASSAHSTAHTEAQRLGLLACLATFNFKRSPGMVGPCWANFAPLIQKSEGVQIAHSQKRLTWKVVAPPHKHMALLAQRHGDWGCLLVLLPQISNVFPGWGFLPGSSCSRIVKIRTSPDSSQFEGASLVSCCSA